jgi:methionyl-tRNA formyltransferase
MRVIFMGSAGFACPSLERLLEADGIEVVGVVTQPDRPRGRHLAMAACPVKAYLDGRAIPVLTPEKVNSPESLAALRALRPDLLVVVAYGQILKRDLLALPPRGCINVHGSLLPKYRGAAPIQWALANGESRTGVTTMFVNERLDAGDIILRRETPILETDDGARLHDRLAVIGAELLVETLGRVRDGTAPRCPQVEAEASLAPKLSKADGRIDWTWPARTIHDRVRGFNPWPGCFCEIPRGSGVLVRVHKTRIEPGLNRQPGEVSDVSAEGPLVQAGSDRGVRLLEVQPEGRKPMSGAAFVCGHALKVGDVLG